MSEETRAVPGADNWLRRGSLRARPVEIDNSDISAQTRELEGGCAANASPRARDNRHLITEFH